MKTVKQDHVLSAIRRKLINVKIECFIDLLTLLLSVLCASFSNLSLYWYRVVGAYIKYDERCNTVEDFVPSGD